MCYRVRLSRCVRFVREVKGREPFSRLSVRASRVRVLRIFRTMRRDRGPDQRRPTVLQQDYCRSDPAVRADILDIDIRDIKEVQSDLTCSLRMFCPKCKHVCVIFSGVY